jgi:His-Xaa-Ser system protein HxsD
MNVADDGSHAEGFRRLEFSNSVYEIEAIKRAAYRFSDRVSVEILPGAEVTVCRLLPVTPAAKKHLDEIVEDFRTEALDQDLRLKVSKETEATRNLILSLAFSKTGLQG